MLTKYTPPLLWTEIKSKWQAEPECSEANKCEAGVWRVSNATAPTKCSELIISTGYRSNTAITTYSDANNSFQQADALRRHYTLVDRCAAIHENRLESFQEFRLWRRQELVHASPLCYHHVFIVAKASTFYETLQTVPYDERKGYWEYVPRGRGARISLKLEVAKRDAPEAYEKWETVLSYYKRAMIDVLVFIYSADRKRITSDIQRIDLSRAADTKVTWFKTKSFCLQDFHRSGRKFMQEVVQQLGRRKLCFFPSSHYVRPFCVEHIYDYSDEGTWIELLLSRPDCDSLRSSGTFQLQRRGNKSSTSFEEFATALSSPIDTQRCCLTMLHADSAAVKELKNALKEGRTPKRRRIFRPLPQQRDVLRHILSIDISQANYKQGSHACTAISTYTCQQVIHNRKSISMCYEMAPTLKTAMEAWIVQGVRIYRNWKATTKRQLASPIDIIKSFSGEMNLRVKAQYTDNMDENDAHTAVAGSTAIKVSQQLAAPPLPAIRSKKWWQPDISNPELHSDRELQLADAIRTLNVGDTGILVGCNSRSIAVGLSEHAWWLFDSHGRGGGDGQTIGTKSVLVFYYDIQRFIHHLNVIYPDTSGYVLTLVSSIFSAY